MRRELQGIAPSVYTDFGIEIIEAKSGVLAQNGLKTA